MLMICLAALIAVTAGLFARIVSIRRSVDEIRMQLARRMQTDTNTGIDVSCSDKKVLLLAADLDRQLKLLRQKQIRYTRGDQELKTAVTNISHDLRTPLTAIYGYLNLLDSEEMSDTAAQYLKLVANRVDAMKALTEELFRYSVILSADSYEETEELSLRAVLEESIAAYYGAILNAGIQPEISLCEQPVKRKLNRQAAARIFSNIISNAVKYSDGDFSVSLDRDGTVVFSNSAQNLDPVTTARLFHRFYTVETGQDSTGLGLSIARLLTERLGGTIQAEYREGRLYITVSFL